MLKNTRNENYKKMAYEDLKELKNKFWEKINLGEKYIYHDTFRIVEIMKYKGELQIKRNRTYIKLRDLKYKDKNELIFSEEFQVPFNSSNRNLDFIKGDFEYFCHICYLYSQILAEMEFRETNIFPIALGLELIKYEHFIEQYEEYLEETKSKKIIHTQKKIKQIERLKQLAEEQELTKGESVDSKIVNKFLRILQKEKLTKSNKPETIRKVLQRLGYSLEKV